MSSSAPSAAHRWALLFPVLPTTANLVPPGFKPSTSGKAIGSFISGLFIFFFPASTVAVILGHLSLSEIRKSAGRLKGQGSATVGLILGYLGLSVIPILIIAAIAIPNLLRAKMAANEASAVGTLRSYSSALASYAVACPQIGFPASLTKLGPGKGCDHAGLLENLLATEKPLRYGYTFIYTSGEPDALGQVTSFTISAQPANPGNTGQHSFFIDQTGVIRMTSSGPAYADSPPLQ